MGGKDPVAQESDPVGDPVNAALSFMHFQAQRIKVFRHLFVDCMQA